MRNWKKKSSYKNSKNRSYAHHMRHTDPDLGSFEFTALFLVFWLISLTVTLAVTQAVRVLFSRSWTFLTLSSDLISFRRRTGINYWLYLNLVLLCCTAAWKIEIWVKTFFPLSDKQREEITHSPHPHASPSFNYYCTLCSVLLVCVFVGLLYLIKHTPGESQGEVNANIFWNAIVVFLISRSFLTLWCDVSQSQHSANFFFLEETQYSKN